MHSTKNEKREENFPTRGLENPLKFPFEIILEINVYSYKLVVFNRKRRRSLDADIARNDTNRKEIRVDKMNSTF